MQIDLFPAGVGTLTAMLILVALCGAADGAAQGALFGEAASLDPRYTQALVAGTAISGISVSLLRIITKAFVPGTPQGLRASADLYFLIAAATCLACILIYTTILPRLNRARYHSPTIIVHISDGEEEEESSRWLRDPEQMSDSVLNDNRAAGGDRNTSKDRSNLPTVDSTSDLIPEEERDLINSERSGLVHFEQCSTPQPPSYLAVAWEVSYLVAALVVIYLVTLSIFPGVLAEDVASIRLGSWYPVILMAVFNAADCIGKWLPAIPGLQMRNEKAILGWAVSRIVFVPLFHFAATRGAGGVVIGILAALLGVSNGVLTAAAMMLGPSLVEPRAAALCGNIMVLSLILGLCLGAACGFLWLL